MVQEYVQAVTEAKGYVTRAAEMLDVTPQSVYTAIKKHAAVREAWELASERALDFAELKLQKLISAENITAIIFYLKTKGRGRGYVERLEHSVDLNAVQRLTDEELEALAQRLGLGSSR